MPDAWSPTRRCWPRPGRATRKPTRKGCGCISRGYAARSSRTPASRSTSRRSAVSDIASVPRSTTPRGKNRWRWPDEHAHPCPRRADLRALLSPLHPLEQGSEREVDPMGASFADNCRWRENKTTSLVRVTHGLGLGFTVFTVIFLLELPDKTALAALLLATRHRPLPIFFGAATAFVVQSAVAVLAGSLFSLLPREPIRIGAGLLFLVMAALLVRRNLRKVEADEEGSVEHEEARHRQPFVTAFTVVFIAEWGDLTQLATAALQARYQQPLVIFVAATLALWAVSAIAVMLGNRLGAWIPERPLQFAAAGVMVLVAIALITGVLG